MHTAYTEGRLNENSIVRMRDVLDAVLEWIPEWEQRTSYAGGPIFNVGDIPPSLKEVPAPEPENLMDFIADRDAAIRLAFPHPARVAAGAPPASSYRAGRRSAG